MGIDYFTCCDCGEISNDCCKFTGCDACDERICEDCMDECLRGSHTYVCDNCWNDEMTPGDVHEVAEFLLKPHQDEYKSFKEVRQVLRDQGKLCAPRVIIDNEEKDRKGFIEMIKAQGLYWDDCDDDTESEDEEPHMVDGMVVIPETTKKHDRPSEIIVVDDDTDEPKPKVAKSD